MWLTAKTREANVRWIIVGLAAGMISPAAAMDYKKWVQAPELFRFGYLISFAEHAMETVSADDKESRAMTSAYEKCLGGTTAPLMMKQIDAYIARNPTEFTGSIQTVLVRTYLEACKPIIDAELAKVGIKY